MNLRRTRAVAWKETLHIVRDWRSLGMAIVIPIVLMVLYGFALTLDVDNVPVAVWDQSGTTESRDYVALYDGSRYFSVRSHVRNYRDLQRAIDTREALVGLVIPTDFARQVASGRPAEVQFVVDASNSNVATIALGYAEAVNSGYSVRVILASQQRKGLRPPAVPIELRPRVWFNEELQSRNYIIPGLIAIIMMVIAALLTSVTVAREWERGTMEQLISTPVKPSELIVGKLAPYFAVGMIDVLLVVLMGEFIFHVPLRGSVGLLFAMAAVFLVGVLSMGILISVATRNQLVASQGAIIVTFVPSFLLSGFVFAISNMPPAIRVITYAVPARYFIAMLKGIYLKGVGLEVLGYEAAMMVCFAVLMLTLAIRKFRKKLQ